MEFIPVESSNVKAIAWENGNLFVKFHNNNVYEYENVEESVFNDFLNADSKGKFLNNIIKKKDYNYKKL